MLSEERHPQEHWKEGTHDVQASQDLAVNVAKGLQRESVLENFSNIDTSDMTYQTLDHADVENGIERDGHGVAASLDMGKQNTPAHD